MVLSWALMTFMLRPVASLIFETSAAALLHGLQAHTTHAAATHAILQNAAAAAATGATAAASPNVLTSAMRDDSNSEKTRAIGRILQIEWSRLKEEPWRGPTGKPAEVVQRFQKTAERRGPIIRWALHLWIGGTLRAQGAIRPVQDAYDHLTRDKVPDFLSSLRMLERELASQVRFGLSTAPLRVFKLLYCSVIVAMCAVVARFPGLGALRAGVRRKWPQLVDHLAATLEQNLETENRMWRGFLIRDGFLEDIKNAAESITGLDIDGDGHVGEPTEDAPADARWACDDSVCLWTDPEAILEDIKYHTERLTGIDFDGDGYVGRPPPPAEILDETPTRLQRVLGRVRRAGASLRGLPARQSGLA